MAEFESRLSAECSHTSSEETQQAQIDKNNLLHRYKRFRKEHPVMNRAAETAAAVGLLYVAGKYGRNGQKPDVPIYRISEEKWDERDLVSWLGNHYDGWGEIRDDLSSLEERAATLYLKRRVRTDRKWLPKRVNSLKAFSSNLSDIPATIAAIKRKRQLPKPK